LIFHDFPSYKPPFSSGIVQLAMFDDTGQAVDRYWGIIGLYEVVPLPVVFVDF
jgi:hypothetical protein